MTLEQPRVFVTVAERQHVTRAAEALNIAQSAVSAPRSQRWKDGTAQNSSTALAAASS
jgi:hypothetical protein